MIETGRFSRAALLRRRARNDGSTLAVLLAFVTLRAEIGSRRRRRCVNTTTLLTL